MSAIYGTVQGFDKVNKPMQTKPRVARGGSRVIAKAQTWKTFAEVTMYADGSGTVEVFRQGNYAAGEGTKIHLHAFSWGNESTC